MSHAVLEAELSPRVHHLPATGVAVAAGALLAGLPAVQGQTGLLIGVAVLQLALVAAWTVATGAEGLTGAVLIGVAAAAGADVALLAPDREQLDPLVVVLGLAFLAAAAHQMTRPAPRPQLVASLAGVLLLVCCVCSLAVLLVVGRVEGGAHAATSAALAVAAALVVGHLVDLALPRPQLAPGVPRGLLGLVAAVLAAVAAALLSRTGDPVAAAVSGAVLGAVAALMALGASYVMSERAQRGWALPVVQAVLPLAAAAPVAYALALHVLR